jgi:hypothetical protein
MEDFEKHNADYTSDAYLHYSFEEFGQIVNFLMKRASMRTDVKKREKDIYDARNYLAMMGAKLNHDVMFM